jgi:hypothetical protein
MRIMSYREQILGIINGYTDKLGTEPASTRDIASWAVSKGLWRPQVGSMIDQCADEIARVLREEYFIAPDGHEVRAKHAARVARNGKQATLWADIRTANRGHMTTAFQQRRQQILGDCRQLQVDVDYFNKNRCPDDPIQMIFDFTLDLAEIEAARNTPRNAA